MGVKCHTLALEFGRYGHAKATCSAATTDVTPHLQSKKGTTCANAVKWAIEAGYRHIDTACLYGMVWHNLCLTLVVTLQDSTHS